MIEVLGKVRLLILVSLVALNALFIGSYYMLLVPQQAEKEMELQSLNSKISAASSDLEQMQVEFSQIESQQEKFEELKATGFFDLQGRRQAESVFEDIQKKSGVIAAKVALAPGKTVEDEEAAKANHYILESSMSVDIDALEDSDVFRYIYYVQEYFPGHISLEKITLKRERDLSADILKNIASKKMPAMVSAKIEMTWRTMIPTYSVLEGNKG